MAKENVISDELMDTIQAELSKGNNWLAYNTSSYFLKKEDLFFFQNKAEANEFAGNNISDYDSFKVIQAATIPEVIRQIPYGENLNKDMEQQIIHISTTNHMNQKNFDYLKDQVKFTGFGEGLQNELKEKMEKQTPEFTLFHNAKYGNDIAATSLQFKKSDQSDMYFFNSYQVNLKNENASDIMKQTFYINKGDNITLKEAYNLMSGRAVNKDLTNKEGQLYNAWLQMDFKQTENNGNYKMKQFHQNYGFDLDKELAKHPIKELTNEQDKSRLMESLQRGNRQSVTFTQNGTDQKNFIEANPQFKTINIYDGNMQRLSSRQAKEERMGEGENNSLKQDGKKESQKNADDDGPDIPKASKKKGKKQTIH